MKVLKYSDNLTQRLLKKDLFTPGEPTEAEIRGGSIWAVELIRRELIKQLQEQQHPGPYPNAILIDFYLWDYAKRNHEEIKDWPIHRIRTLFY